METIHILLALIIVIIFLVVGYWDESGVLVKSTIMLAGFGLVALISNWTTVSEKLETLEITRKPTNDTQDFNIDDNRFSEYGNISQMNDLNPLDQRSPDFEFDQSDDIDNSDIVEDSLRRSSSTFQPNNTGGVTPITSAEKSHFRMAHPPTSSIAGLDYSVPLGEAGLNADANLARKQHHRASINKRAIDGAVRSTRNKFAKYFQNELDENESRIWWETDQNLETDWF